ncbi:helix-turn-helix domain-containing protein [Saccharibacillus qingshengii]|uniref:helix-turn-helix domain-containing protein n=1 Tax=Saccharibacillus qingshengii TaxID=1763540 RepID=UPI0015565FB3|nr:helix-turn-helix domain-containing protein [Saccharibacillus qingshengii]
MTQYMDYTISPVPIRVFSPPFDPVRRRIKSIALVNAGHLPGRTLQRENVQFHHWAIVLITGGQGHYRVDVGETQRVEAGSWFCVYPGVLFDYGPDPGGYWDEYYFTAEGERVEEWRRGWLPPEGQVHGLAVSEALLQRLENLLRLVGSGTPGNLDRAAMQLEQFVYEIAAGGEEREAGRRELLVQKVIEDIQSVLHLPPTVSDMAARHHVSVSTLRRIVHEYTGYPFNEFLHRLRTGEAGHMLLNTDMSVKELGERLGYRDMFYFSRVFKRITGVSPREYRSRVGP